jgi:hypothetical protein
MDPSHSPGRWVPSTLRLYVLLAVALVVAVFVALIATGFGFTGSDTLWIALPMVVGVADVVLVPQVGSTVRPLPYGAGEEDLRRISAGALRTVIMLRLVLAEAAAAFGLVSAVLADSLLPYAIGAAFAIPLLVVYAYPGRRVVDEVRRRLESGGVAAHLTGQPGRPPERA